MRKIDKDMIREYERHIIKEEKSPATTEKYIRDIILFERWAEGKEIDKTAVMEYKEALILKYAPRSVNSILSSLNSLFDYLCWYDCKVKTLKIQKQIFVGKDKELTRAEYERLLQTAKSRGHDRIYYLMQTICATGIRVSELKHITVEAVKNKCANIQCKGKIRAVLLPGELCRMLTKYIKKCGIKSGSVFVTRSGKPMDRSNIWSEMKRLAKLAGVAASKVFPHNLRHLFARVYYSLHKDIVRLADILGHSNVNTTRIYTIESGEVHRRQIEKMGLLRC